MADLRQRVYSMLGQKNNRKRKRRTISGRIKRDEIDLPTEHLPRNDRSTSFNGKNFKCLKNAAVNRIGVSQRKRGKKNLVLFN